MRLILITAFCDFVFRIAITDDVITRRLINGRGHELVCGWRNSCSIFWWNFLIHIMYCSTDMVV